MNNRPAVKILIAYLIGIILADRFNINLTFLWVISAILIIIAFFSYKKRWLSFSSVLLGLCFIMFGFMRYDVSIAPPKNLDKVAYQQVKVYGTVIDSQKERNGGSSLLINGEAYLPSNPSTFMRGKIYVRSWIDDINLEQYNYGDVIGLDGLLTKPLPARNPDAFDYQKYMHRQGVFATMTVNKVDNIYPLGFGGNIFLRLISNFRNNIENVIQEISKDEDTRAILKGIVIGEKGEMPIQLYGAFRRTSTTHILVVSGVNFAILAGWVYGIFIFFKKRATKSGIKNPIFENTKLAYIPVIPIVIIYALMAGAEFSVIRAFIFIFLLILSRWLDRDSDIFNTLALAGFCILIFSPGALWNVGFQMTFISVASIAYLMPYWASLFSKYRKNIVLYGLLQGIATSISAQLGVGLLIAYSFGTFSLSGFVANPLIAPLVVLLTPTGFISCLVGLVFLPLGSLLGWIDFGIVWLLKSIVTWFSQFWFSSIPIKNISLMHVILGFALIIFIANITSILRKRKIFNISLSFMKYLDDNEISDSMHNIFNENRIRLSQNAKVIICKLGKKWLITDNPSDDWSDHLQAYLIKKESDSLCVYKNNQLPLISCIAIISLAFWAWATTYEGNITKVTYLDVGEADSAIIDFPKDYEIIIDGGSHRNNYSAGERVIAPFLRKQGINDIELMVSTHPDNDHSGGLTYIVDNVKVDKAITGSYGLTSPTYNKLVETFNNNHVDYYDATPQTIYENDGIKIEILSNGYKHYLKNEEHRMNNNSIVMKVKYKEVSFLFTGDIQKEAEKQLVSSGHDLKATILKVPHHGSISSSSNEFIQAVQPYISIISVGYRNYFRHPSPYVIRRYERIGSEVYRTDLQGAITIITDGRHGWIKTCKSSL